MQVNRSGFFFGSTRTSLSLSGITLTDTEYTHDFVDWHRHEQAHFTFMLKGKLIEKNNQTTHLCQSGDLIFHHAQDRHYNQKPPGFSRGFHIEFNNKWFDFHSFEMEKTENSVSLNHPVKKSLCYQLFLEMQHDDLSRDIIIEEKCIDLIHLLISRKEKEKNTPPRWIDQIESKIRSEYSEAINLQEWAAEFGIHPVHLSRYFKKFKGLTMGAFQRKIRLEKAFQLMHQADLSLTQIALDCGFADQSHFIRSFKSLYSVSPKIFRKYLSA